MMIELQKGVGYAGKHGSKVYVAAILGRSQRYRFERVFLDPDSVERDHWGRSKYTLTFTYDLDPGLYEISEGGERWYQIIWIRNGEEVKTKISEERAEKIAELLDAGIEFEEARLMTRPNSGQGTT